MFCVLGLDPLPSSRGSGITDFVHQLHYNSRNEGQRWLIASAALVSVFSLSRAQDSGTLIALRYTAFRDQRIESALHILVYSREFFSSIVFMIGLTIVSTATCFATVYHDARSEATSHATRVGSRRLSRPHRTTNGQYPVVHSWMFPRRL
jgi:hypothetical protein